MPGEDVSKQLSPAQRGAVALEVAGRKTDEIAETLDVSAGTLRKWRKLPLYQVALDEQGRRASEALQPIITEVHNELAQGVREAFKTLVRNMDSDDEKISNDAAIALAKYADFLIEKPGRRGGDGDGGGAAAAQAVVKVSISEDVAREGSPFHVDAEDVEVEDAEVVE